MELRSGLLESDVGWDVTKQDAQVGASISLLEA